MTDGSTRGSSRLRGRPARLSRAQIIEAAVTLAYQDPLQPLTLRRVAEVVNSAPMALYRYFPDRDDLLRAVVDRVLADIRVTSPEGATWQTKLRTWMLMSVDRLRKFPHLLPFVASTREPAWLPSCVLLTEMLGPVNLSDEDNPLAIALVGTTIVIQATLAAERTPVVNSLPSTLDRLHDVVIDITIETIEDLTDRRGNSRQTAGLRPRIDPSKALLTPKFSHPETAD